MPISTFAHLQEIFVLQTARLTMQNEVLSWKATKWNPRLIVAI